MSSTQEKPVKNTDVELWREPTNEPGMSYYMPSVHVTQAGKIGINVGGSVYVKSLTEWHELAGGSLVQSPNPSDQSTQEKLEEKIFNLVYQWGRVGIVADHTAPTYVAYIQELIDSAKREVLEQIRPPQATIDSMKLTQPHKYRGVEYPCCSICGFCPEAINAFIDSQLEQSEESE